LEAAMATQDAAEGYAVEQNQKDKKPGDHLANFPISKVR